LDNINDHGAVEPKIWAYNLPDGGRIWLFIDVKKENSTYEALFCLIEIENKCITYRDVGKTKPTHELARVVAESDNERDVLNYLLRSMFMCGKGQFESRIMHKYETIKEEEKKISADNPYHHAILCGELSPVRSLYSVVTPEECVIIKENIIPLMAKDKYDMARKLENKIGFMEKYNTRKHQLAIKLDQKFFTKIKC